MSNDGLIIIPIGLLIMGLFWYNVYTEKHSDNPPNYTKTCCKCHCD